MKNGKKCYERDNKTVRSDLDTVPGNFRTEKLEMGNF